MSAPTPHEEAPATHEAATPGADHTLAAGAEMTVPDALRLGMLLHQRGDRAGARTVYERVLAAAPDYPDALHFLGLLERQEGQHALAYARLEAALALAPDYSDARINLGNLLKEDDRPEAAVEQFRRALELRPEHAGAHNNLGVTLAALGQTDEGLAHCRKATEIDPEVSGYQLNLGQMLRRMGRIDEALTHFNIALNLDPTQAHYRLPVAIGLCHLGRTDDAIAVFEKWVEEQPWNPEPRHHLAALRGVEVPRRAPDAYVRQVFDNFAGSFEAKLELLEYRTPQAIGKLVEAALGPSQARLDVLDAGCGTGLCAPFLKPYARRLAGVDLSGGMLQRAQARGLYDWLEATELCAYLEGTPAAWNLIVAADVLCYFGDLGQVFGLVAAALCGEGLFAFSVEQANAADAPGGWRLHGHGRYSHSEDYVRSTLAAAGLELQVLDLQSLRKENLVPVPGLLVLAHKAAGADRAREFSEPLHEPGRLG